MVINAEQCGGWYRVREVTKFKSALNRYILVIQKDFCLREVQC